MKITENKRQFKEYQDDYYEVNQKELILKDISGYLRGLYPEIRDIVTDIFYIYDRFDRDSLLDMDTKELQNIIDEKIKSNKYYTYSYKTDTAWLDAFLMSSDNNTIIEDTYDLDLKLNRYALKEVVKEVSNYLIKERIFL